METQPTASATSIEENINLVKSTYDCFFRGDIEGLLANHSDDIDWQVYGPSEIPTSGLRLGKEEVVQFFQQVSENFEFTKFDVQQYVAQGDTVVALGEYAGTTKTAGKEFEMHFAHVMTIENGKATKFREFTDTAAVIKALS